MERRRKAIKVLKSLPELILFDQADDGVGPLVMMMMRPHWWLSLAPLRLFCSHLAPLTRTRGNQNTTSSHPSIKEKILQKIIDKITRIYIGNVSWYWLKMKVWNVAVDLFDACNTLYVELLLISVTSWLTLANISTSCGLSVSSVSMIR